MVYFKYLPLCFWLSLCIACSSDHQPSAHSADTAPAGVIPQAQLKALENAKGVEIELKQSDETRRQQLDAATE